MARYHGGARLETQKMPHAARTCSVPGVVVAADAVTLPIGDVVPAAGSGDTIRTTVSLVTNA